MSSNIVKNPRYSTDTESSHSTCICNLPSKAEESGTWNFIPKIIKVSMFCFWNYFFYRKLDMYLIKSKILTLHLFEAENYITSKRKCWRSHCRRPSWTLHVWHHESAFFQKFFRCFVWTLELKNNVAITNEEFMNFCLTNLKYNHSNLLSWAMNSAASRMMYVILNFMWQDFSGSFNWVNFDGNFEVTVQILKFERGW